MLLPYALAVLTLAALATRNGRLFLSGRPMDGSKWTDATFLSSPLKAHNPEAIRSWWHWRPGWHRAAIRVAVLATAAATGYGMLTDPPAVIDASLAAASCAAAALAGRLTVGAVRWKRAVTWDRAHPWRSAWRAATLPWDHYWHYVRPYRYALTAELGTRPLRVRVPYDRSWAKVRLSYEFTGADKTCEKVTRCTTSKLALEAPDTAWKLYGRAPRVTYTRSDPPPSRVTWEDIADAIASARPNELIFGMGKQGAIGRASYGQAAHLAIPGGSGGGKSNLAAVLLLQEMMRGSLIFNLDPKWTSHLWLQGLPNVINAHDIPDLHLALCWLGRELPRRNKAVYYSANGTGRARATPGQRIIVLCEELNYGMDGLKDYWREIRGKDGAKQSPAVTGLKALSCAGRAADIREWLLAQLLTVASTGVSDSTIRTNAGIKAMVRWNPPGWQMAIGKHVAMPPPTTTPGRIQLVTDDIPQEVQVPYLHLDDDDNPAVADKAVAWARELAVSGTVAQIPTGPEGIPEQLWPASVLGRAHSASPSIGAGQVPWDVETVPASLTIREAVDEDFFGPDRGDAAVWRARKRIQRAQIEPDGQRGDGSYTYDRDGLIDAARNRRKELAR